MRKMIVVIGFMGLVFVGCSSTKDDVVKDNVVKDSVTEAGVTEDSATKDSVTISTDITSYTPLMSSARGFTLTPEWKTDKDYEKIVYHWVTDQGEFINGGKEVRNQGESVVWSAISGECVTAIEDPIYITLEVLEGESDQVLAETGLTIIEDNGFYTIKE